MSVDNETIAVLIGQIAFLNNRVNILETGLALLMEESARKGIHINMEEYFAVLTKKMRGERETATTDETQ